MKKVIKLIYDRVPFKKSLFSIIKLIYKPPQTIYRHLYFKGIIKVKIEDKSFKMYHFGYLIENEIFWRGLTGGYEKVSISLWIELCKTSNCIMDIGANTGIYALVAKTLNANAKVYAFEPVKRVYEKLKLNCGLNKYDIICEELAISSYNGRGVIYDQDTEHIYSVTVNKNMSSPNTKVITTDIQTVKIPTYIKEKKVPRVDLMKIDVETHEADVLAGMEEYLRQMRPTMLIEILNDEVGEGVERILTGKNYLYFYIDENSYPLKVEHLIKRDFDNYLICSEEVAEKLRLLRN